MKLAIILPKLIVCGCKAFYFGNIVKEIHSLSNAQFCDKVSTLWYNFVLCLNGLMNELWAIFSFKTRHLFSTVLKGYFCCCCFLITSECTCYSERFLLVNSKTKQIFIENAANDNEVFGKSIHHITIHTWFIHGSLVPHEDKQPRKLWMASV